MCDTCGCENNNEVKIIDPAKCGLGETIHDHTHNHGHSCQEDQSLRKHSNHQHNKEISIEKDIMYQNNLMAARNRGYFEAKNIFAYNFVSSPGSGKTSILERTILELKNNLNFYVIEGDQQSLNDAKRIQETGVPVLQINTGNSCHLDAKTIHKAKGHLQLMDNSVLFIENVGNLVCPSLFDLGEKKRVVIISTTEGDDKPVKYPYMFQSSHVCIINKMDLIPYLDCNVEKIKEYALQVNPDIIFFELSAKTGEGMEKWFEYIVKTVS